MKLRTGGRENPTPIHRLTQTEPRGRGSTQILMDTGEPDSGRRFHKTRLRKRIARRNNVQKLIQTRKNKRQHSNLRKRGYQNQKFDHKKSSRRTNARIKHHKPDERTEVNTFSSIIKVF